MDIIITNLSVQDIRFPTTSPLQVINKDPDYSAAYVTLYTNQPHLKGYGMTFTIGRGNELCVAAVNALRHLIVGKRLADITAHMGLFWHEITNDNQLRWIGLDKGVLHLATAAIVNAVWDLWARFEQKPVWELVASLSPQDLLNCIDFSYLTDVITVEEALSLLQKQAATKSDRIQHLKQKGYPAYTSSTEWSTYTEEQLRELCVKLINQGQRHLKLKVGTHLENDIRRLTIAREILGENAILMLETDQQRDTHQTIEWMHHLAPFKPLWIEGLSHPDDILGHANIRSALKPIGVTTGKHCANRVLFKHFFQMNALDYCQIDNCRLGGLNEVLAVLLLAAKFNIPACLHTAGVGLNEYAQHIAMIDYICISGSLENRDLEYTDHLQEHFVTPAHIEQGHYQAPVEAGFSVEMKATAIEHYRYAIGNAWRDVLPLIENEPLV